MKRKKFVLLLLIAVLFTFTACSSSNSENTNKENKEGGEEINTISDVKNQSYVMTLDSYVTLIRNVANSGKLKMYNTSTLYLIPVGKNPYVLESGENSPYSKEWKYIFVGVKYNGSGFNYYIMALDGNNIGTDFRTINTLELDSIETLEEVSTFKTLYNLKEDTLYESNNMSNDLKELTRISNTENIQVYVK